MDCRISRGPPFPQLCDTFFFPVTANCLGAFTFSAIERAFSYNNTATELSFLSVNDYAYVGPAQSGAVYVQLMAGFRG